MYSGLSEDRSLYAVNNIQRKLTHYYIVTQVHIRGFLVNIEHTTVALVCDRNSLAISTHHGTVIVFNDYFHSLYSSVVYMFLRMPS